MFSDADKILVCRKHRKAVTNAKLRQEGVYRANLKPCSATMIAQGCSIDMIPAVGRN